MKRKYVIGTVMLLLVILISWKLTGNKKKLNEKNTTVETGAVKIPVKVAPAEEKLLEISIEKTGNLAPFKEAKVVAATGGTLQRLNCNLGDNVREGQVLAVLDNRLAQLDLQKSETNVAKLKNDLETYTELLKGKATTQEKVNEIRQNYNDAVNQSSQIRKQLGDATVKAPTSGIISAKAVEQGVYVTAGTEIATIINLSKAKVQVYLTEKEVYQVKQGQSVKITTDVYPDKIFTGTVSFISPQADATHSYMAEIMVNNTGEAILRSGTFVYADFSTKMEQQVLVIPREALTESIKNASVYVIENGRARLRNVKVGRDTNGLLEITEGLQKGEQVVVSGQINLKDSTEVSVSK
jgi:RND family efflux transporter MFP subunit